MIGPDTVVVGKGISPRISRERFMSLIGPIVTRPASGVIYDRIVRLSVDPLFVLAIAWVESKFGQDPRSITVRYRLFNPGSRRTAVLYKRETVQTEKGPFVRYQDWVEGWTDIAGSLSAPEFVYARENRRTIREIVERWAPPSENDTSRYLDAVIEFMRRETDMSVPPILSSEEVDPVSFRVSLLAPSAPNYGGYGMKPRWITVHETANTRSGANAEMHRRFVHNGGGTELVSFHFVVDDREIVQLLPLDVNGWHAGDGVNGEGNRSSIGIEICVNRDGNWGKTLEHVARLLAALCRRYGFGVDRIVQHNRWSGKNCPATLRQSGWDDLIRKVAGMLEKGTPRVRYFPETGRTVGHGFLDFFERYGGVRVFGYPLTEELTEKVGDVDRTVQYFEKAVFEYWPENPPEWRVLLRRLGAEALAEKEQGTSRKQAVQRIRELLANVSNFLDTLDPGKT
jgi:N-acetyl-anhydromuramyl-L-alanine amidase AmpD